MLKETESPQLGQGACLYCFDNVTKLDRDISNSRSTAIAQFRYIKIQPKTIDFSTRLVGITTEFVGFIPTSLVLRSIVLG